jgi:polyhydroxyalkanoate synthesis regulator phasin
LKFDARTRARRVNLEIPVKINANLKWTAVVLSLALIGCDAAEKKAAEAKAAADATMALAEKAKAQAQAEIDAKMKEASQKAMEQLTTQKTELGKTVTEAVEAMDRKIAFLKERSAKLPKAAAAKATAAFEAFDGAKAKLLALKGELEAAKDPAAFADLSAKATAAVTEAQSALSTVESTVIVKK